MLIPTFLIVSLAAAIGFALISGCAAWKAVLFFLAGFAAVNLLFLLFWWIVSLTVDPEKKLEKQNQLCRKGCAQIAEFLCACAGARPRISGIDLLPWSERFLFVCNHRSMFDPLIVADRLREYNISFVSKPSNMSIPIAGRLSLGAGYLPIDRENDRNALRTILQAADYLKNDLCSVGIYPEGTRSRTQELLPFHPGSFKIAQRAGVPLVIAAVSGSEKVSGRLFMKTEVQLDILEVLPAEKVREMSTKELAEYSRTVIENRLMQNVQ